MSTTGRKTLSAFSLIEILISLALFSILITAVISISISMVNAEKNVQAQLFLTQTAETVLESMSRQIRYGYNYTGSTQDAYDSSEGHQTIYAHLKDVSNDIGSFASSTQNLINAENSPFILFESQDGNPNSWADQNAFCVYDGKLYKVTNFDIETDGLTYKAKCEDGYSMLPDNITIDKLSFDIYAGVSGRPKSPIVRVKMRLRHESAGALDVQTSVTQRLITYF